MSRVGKIEHIGKDGAETIYDENVVDGTPEPARKSWPDRAADEAFHGLAGQFVRLASPYTESDDHSLLGQFLVFFGNAAGRASYINVGADRHTTNIFLVMVGDTGSGGRKGTSYSLVHSAFEKADPFWTNQIATGLSSGEGLIWAVRDPIEQKTPIKERGRVVRTEMVTTDYGVENKELLVVETEFSSPLKLSGREGNILTGVIRQAWDSGSLRNLVKTSPAKATGAHISIIGHIPQDELLRFLPTTELGNGFGNRHLWMCVKRSKEIPEPIPLPDKVMDEVASGLQRALEFAKGGREVRRDAGAREMWRQVYGTLSSRKPGLLGALLSRAEAQVTRLQLLYALLDCSPVISSPHLAAALAFWEYSEASVRYIFGDAVGDPVADAILHGLRESGAGLTRTEISSLFGRNQDRQRIEPALAALRRQDLARPAREESGGRPVERWVAVRPGDPTS